MKPVRFSMFPANVDDDNICASQTPSGAGNLTLNGVAAGNYPVVATLDMPRRVVLTFAGDETGHNFTVYGYPSTTSKTNPIQETIAGTGIGTVISTLDFGVVTRIAIDAAATGAVKAGTSAATKVASSPWQIVDPYLDPSSLTINVDVSGTVHYTVDYTYGDVMGGYSATSGLFVPATLPPSQILPDAVLVDQTADGETTYNNPISAWRVTMLSYSSGGGVSVTGIQAGVTT